MKVSGIDIESNIDNIKAQIEADKTLSASMRAAIDLLLLIVERSRFAAEKADRVFN